MNKELKKAIINYMLDNENEFQLVNATKDEFRQYIYTESGDYCYGGEDVSMFVNKVAVIIKNN